MGSAVIESNPLSVLAGAPPTNLADARGLRHTSIYRGSNSTLAVRRAGRSNISTGKLIIPLGIVLPA